jgi:hypothetical protein
MRKRVTMLVVGVTLVFAVAGAQDRRLNQDPTGLPQGEVMIAVDPNNSQHLVATWMDWNGPRGGETTTAHARSLDGGATWQTAITSAPGVPPPIYRYDPSVAIDGLGNVFELDDNSYFGEGAWVFRSSDGGLTFTGGTQIETGVATDKTWIAADPVNNNIYVTYTRVNDSNTGGVKFARSLDHGITFSTRLRSLRQGSQWRELHACGGPGRGLRRLQGWSDDQAGSVPRQRGDVAVHRPYRRHDRATDVFGQRGLHAVVTPNIAVDRTNGPFRGRLYVVWADGRNGDVDVYMASSADTGTTWTAPLRVNDDYVGGGAEQIQPTVWVDDAGHVHVQFLDRRDDPANLKLAVYLATSTNGGASFGPNVRISDRGCCRADCRDAPHVARRLRRRRRGRWEEPHRVGRRPYR